MNKSVRTVILAVVIALIIAAIYMLEQSKPGLQDSNITNISASDKAKQYNPAQEITTPDGFINTDGITISDLVGKKVLLIDFWTYSCINCQRTTPFLNSWYEKYRDQGLEIIGIHTPEFEFEKKYSNVLHAVEEENIKFPVVLDNDFSTWRAYENRYWPHKYLIDIDGYIVYDHIGEGGYEETEQKIQELLNERINRLGMGGEIIQELTSESMAEISVSRSPETYFGSSRNILFANGIRNTAGTQSLTVPETIRENNLYLGGDWLIQPEFAKNQMNADSIVYRYAASKVFMVAGSSNGRIRIHALIDGTPIPKELAGDDVVYENDESVLYVDAQKLYTIIKGSDLQSHVLTLYIDDPGLEVFTFTFG